MEWLNLHTSILRTPEYVASEPVERATWLNLLAYSCDQENGGRIVGAGLWKDRQWQQTCGVTLKEVRNTQRLLEWDGDDLIVFFYPLEKQNEVQAKREGGRAGGIRSGKSRSKDNRSSASSSASSTPSSSALSSASTEGKGRERKGKEACASEAQLPESLDTPALQKLWPDWLEHWSSTFAHGKPMPEQTAHAQLRALTAIGPERACTAINNAITRGLREPAEPFAGTGKAQPATRPEKKYKFV